MRLRDLPGMLRDAWVEYEQDRARYFAVAMVYYALVSLVPLVLLLLSALGLLLRYSDQAAATERQVLLAVETSLGPPVRSGIEKLFEQLQRDSIVATAIGLIGLLVAASSLFRHLRLSLRGIWHQAPPVVSGAPRAAIRATIVEYVIAYAILLGGGLLLVLAFVLISVTQWLGGLLVAVPPFDRTPAWVLALPSSVIFVGLTFAFLLKYLPPIRLKWRDVWLATVLCTVAWMVGTELVVLAGALFRQGPTAAGALGSLLVAMVWLSKVSQLLFYGAEVCKVAHFRAEATA
jgi:membrane protein